MSPAWHQAGCCCKGKEPPPENVYKLGPCYETPPDRYCYECDWDAFKEPKFITLTFNGLQPCDCEYNYTRPGQFPPDRVYTRTTSIGLNGRSILLQAASPGLWKSAQRCEWSVAGRGFEPDEGYVSTFNLLTYEAYVNNEDCSGNPDFATTVSGSVVVRIQREFSYEEYPWFPSRGWQILIDSGSVFNGWIERVTGCEANDGVVVENYNTEAKCIDAEFPDYQVQVYGGQVQIQFGDVFQHGEGCPACPGGMPIYTTHDFSASVGKYALLIDRVCYRIETTDKTCDEVDCYDVEVLGIFDTQEECCTGAASEIPGDEPDV